MINVTAHMVVKNEDRFIWYAISSVLKHVSKFIITDTGSTDQTVSIIKSFQDKKIQFTQYLAKFPEDITKVRQMQLDDTKTDWIWIVDGDEVYSEVLISELENIISQKGNNLEGIVVRRLDLLGDIFHYQDDSAGYYELFGNIGHFALRLINKKNIELLHLEGKYPYEGYYDKEGLEITKHNKDKFCFTDRSLHHATYLQRSTKAANLQETFNRLKYKIEKGQVIQKSEIPQLLFKKNLTTGESVSANRTLFYEFAADLITPLKKLKRSFF